MTRTRAKSQSNLLFASMQSRNETISMLMRYVRETWVGKVLTVLGTSLGLLAFWRDEGLAGRQLPPLLQLLPWYAWIVLALACLLILMFEAVHRLRLSTSESQRVPKLSDALSIEPETRGSSETYLCLVLINHGDVEVQNCRVKLRSVDFYDDSGNLGEPGWYSPPSVRDVYLQWSANEGGTQEKTIAIDGRGVCDLVASENGHVIPIAANSIMRNQLYPADQYRFTCDVEATGFRTMTLTGAFEHYLDTEAAYIVRTLRFVDSPSVVREESAPSQSRPSRQLSTS